MPLTDIVFDVDELGGTSPARFPADSNAIGGGSGSGASILSLTLTPPTLPALASGDPAGQGAGLEITLENSGASEFDLLAGTLDFSPFFISYGFESVSMGIGALVPGTFNGLNIVGIYQLETFGPPAKTFNVLIDGIVAVNFFTSITINGVTYLTSGATFTNPGGRSYWEWTIAGITLVPTVTYPVEIE